MKPAAVCCRLLVRVVRAAELPETNLSPATVREKVERHLRSGKRWAHEAMVGQIRSFANKTWIVNNRRAETMVLTQLPFRQAEDVNDEIADCSR
ncbi:hypothetical protein [Paraburkholderia sp. Clong3]|uniref:hypothetical protein n=2 Tax=unclassified Paraburkholderia TaxID=2615204 RepID=UPI003D23C8CA